MDYTVHYYDLVLVAIAASMVAGVVVGAFTVVSLSVSIPVLGLVAIAIVGHALFVNGPVERIEYLAEEVEPEQVPGGSMLRSASE